MDGERNAGGSQRILASAFEAVLGALYLDQGLEAVRAYLLPRIDPLARQIVAQRLFKDNKSRFQELAQAAGWQTSCSYMPADFGASNYRFDVTLERPGS